ncbi:HlyD family type I secretion periplasmic adaptor subunit [Devosia sp. WQ 349]|uniref:HlyD family type I secretion periplasmic adaptor subunit n=1 Tax=Devosia sp. WQ 349K1 TaxID=2800329 RepID=UPI0019069C91|nr:HlyD family type I secretion periplasmic adaptor subunit [Devosia sp. WQ 349K1]MBK1792879.1 HlyD family type I secretion periplasmic adaptor subunit [Devosia sp. WQ 349K1]
MRKYRKDSFKLGSRVLLGSALSVLLVGGAGGWAATAEISGAVIAQGQIVVDQQIKTIQHRDGGIIGQIAIREGDSVTAGQVLLRLEDSQTKAELSIIEAQRWELTARRARLLAERDLLETIVFPESLDASIAEVDFLVTGESRVFHGNLSNRNSRKQQLVLVVEQVAEEVTGLEAQRGSKHQEIALVEQHRARLDSLVSKQLMEQAPLYAADRDIARLMGESGEIDAAIARARSKMNELKLQILSIDETSRTEAQRELNSLDTKMSELQDRHNAISDRLARTEIRAPIDGVVNELNMHTIGGVITPAEILVTIVPLNAQLKVEFGVPPISIDQVSIGSSARLRLPALNQRTTPELTGKVTHMSPATARDPVSGQFFYRGDVILDEGEITKIGASQLIPGMPVEVYVTTEERTALSYFVQPITDQIVKVFRER